MHRFGSKYNALYCVGGVKNIRSKFSRCCIACSIVILVISLAWIIATIFIAGVFPRLQQHLLGDGMPARANATIVLSPNTVFSKSFNLKFLNRSCTGPLDSGMIGTNTGSKVSVSSILNVQCSEVGKVTIQQY